MFGFERMYTINLVTNLKITNSSLNLWNMSLGESMVKNNKYVAILVQNKKNKASIRIHDKCFIRWLHRQIKRHPLRGSKLDQDQEKEESFGPWQQRLSNRTPIPSFLTPTTVWWHEERWNWNRLKSQIIYCKNCWKRSPGTAGGWQKLGFNWSATAPHRPALADGWNSGSAGYQSRRNSLCVRSSLVSSYS